MDLQILQDSYLDFILYSGINIFLSILLYLILIWLKNRITANIQEKSQIFDLLNIVLERLNNVIIFIIVFLFISQNLFQNYPIIGAINIFLSLIFFIQLAFIVDGVSVYLISSNNKLKTTGRKSAVKNAISLIKFFARSAIWSIALLLCVDNIGVDITALVAGLGIGGIAIALAAQNILGDLFASLAIVLDKPFEIDDYIVVGDISGTVEQIGINVSAVALAMLVLAIL